MGLELSPKLTQNQNYFQRGKNVYVSELQKQWTFHKVDLNGKSVVTLNNHPKKGQKFCHCFGSITVDVEHADREEFLFFIKKNKKGN